MNNQSALPVTHVLVREADINDAELIAELTRMAWAERVAPTSSGHCETTQRALQDLQQGGGFVLLADDTPIGSVRWAPVDTEEDVWEIMRMGVLPTWRGEGLSQHLLEAVIHHAQTSDVRELRLGVRADQTRLVDLYAAYGFEVAPELEYTHANTREPEPIVMRRMLRH